MKGRATSPGEVEEGEHLSSFLCFLAGDFKVPVPTGDRNPGPGRESLRGARGGNMMFVKSDLGIWGQPRIR